MLDICPRSRFPRPDASSLSPANPQAHKKGLRIRVQDQVLESNAGRRVDAGWAHLVHMASQEMWIREEGRARTIGFNHAFQPEHSAHASL